MGGIPFFSSLISLIYLALFSPFFLIALIDSSAIYNVMWLVAGLLLGVWIADLMIRGHLSVFIHELKHSALSNLVGNKFVGFMIRKNHGHFKYKYTKDTAKFNAIICLAPYFLPIFTIPGLGIVFLLHQNYPNLAILFLGICLGSDLLLSIRDIGDHQTDFQAINGGFYVGLTYVIAMNVVISTVILAWVMHGKQGIKLLVYEHIKLISRFVGLDID